MVKRKAMSDLVEMYSGGETSPLLDVMNHEDVEIRREAVRSLTLSMVNDFQPTELFIAALKDQDPEVVGHAILALGWTGDSRALNPLIEIL